MASLLLSGQPHLLPLAAQVACLDALEALIGAAMWAQSRRRRRRCPRAPRDSPHDSPRDSPRIPQCSLPARPREREAGEMEEGTADDDQAGSFTGAIITTTTTTTPPALTSC